MILLVRHDKRLINPCFCYLHRILTVRDTEGKIEGDSTLLCWRRVRLLSVILQFIYMIIVILNESINYVSVNQITGLVHIL